MASQGIRVLYLTPYFHPYLGGIERAIQQLALALGQSQTVAAVGVLTTKYAFPRLPYPDWADRDTSPDGIPIFRLRGYPGRALPFFSVPLVWFSPFKIRRYLKEFNPDVVHFVGDGWFWGHFWTWFWYRRHAWFVFTPSFHTLPLRRQWLRPLNGFLCGVVDRVVALTRQESEQLRRAYWVRQDKLRVIGWGASLPKYPRRLLHDPAVTVLCVGRLGQHKGQMWLLDVYGRARASFTRPARLVLVGRDEGAEDEIHHAVRTAGLDGEVTITGEVSDSDLAAWYAQSDVLALFSQYEAFGLVFFEAMVHGVPVLTHDVGANRELLSRGASVVPRFDAQAAVAELVRLVNDDKYRLELAREAREYASREFSWEAVAQQYLRIYQASGQEERG